MINNTLKAVTAFVTLLFSAGTIVWLLLYGQAGNSLHASALSWSYTLLLATLVGLGIDAGASFFTPKTPGS